MCNKTPVITIVRTSQVFGWFINNQTFCRDQTCSRQLCIELAVHPLA